MKQFVKQRHIVDDEGHPAGGRTWGTGIDIIWQAGPLMVDGERQEPNGAFVEGVIEAAIGRLEFYQRSPFACEDNAAALVDLNDALEHLRHRTADREARGVEGTHEV